MNKVIRGMGFHHVAIKSRNFDKSLKFYESLGCTVTVSWGSAPKRAVMLDLGDGGCIELFEGGVEEKVHVPTQSGEWVHLALAADDPDTAYESALAAGATDRTAPHDVTIKSDPPIPVRNAFVYGPDGEVIEFFRIRSEE